jgi:FkbM family methyltransferase
MTMWRSNEPVEDDISDLPGIDFQNKCRRARRRAWRDGLSDQTVVKTLENVRSYRAFERALVGRVDPRSVLELALVHGLASLLWRLRRACAIETGLFALSARGHLVLCEQGDVRFFADPSDRVVGAWLMWHGGWQRREIDTAVEVLAAARRLRPDAVFVDVGAHIGTHTIYALRTGRFARAIAFEPEPRNAALLARNLKANGLAHAARIVAKAAGAAPSTAVLHLHPRNTGAHAIGAPPSVDGTACLEVPVVRVDDEIERLGVALENVGLAWIDVEGYEPHVLDGLARLMSRSVPISFEFTPRRYSAESKARLVRCLTQHYTTVHSLGRREGTAPVGMVAAREQTDDVLVY